MRISFRAVHRAAMGLTSVALLLAAPAAAMAGTAGSHQGSARAGDGVAWAIADPAGSRPVVMPDGCARGRAQLARDAARGIDRVMCVTAAGHVVVASLPSLCHPRRQEFDRFADCLDAGWVDLIIDVENGEVVGSVTGATILWNTLAYNSRTWEEHIRVVIATVTGEGTGTTFTAPIECHVHSAGCRPTGKGLWAGQDGYLAADEGAVYSGELGWHSPGSATDKLAIQVNMIFDNPVANPAPLTIGPTETIRCDSQAIFRPTKGGCVYLNATENILEISASDHSVTEAAKFIKEAQKKIHNHAGVFRVGRALTRLTDRSLTRRNRRVACKGLRVHKGQSCDEYPFASTYQGAALVPRKDYDRDAVNAAQNSKVGTYLSTFLLHLRIASKDSYYVKIVS